jgi:hypothetical protein
MPASKRQQLEALRAQIEADDRRRRIEHNNNVNQCEYIVVSGAVLAGVLVFLCIVALLFGG